MLADSNSDIDGEALGIRFKFFNYSKSVLLKEQSSELGLIQNSQIGREFKVCFFDLQSRIDSLNQILDQHLDSISTSKLIRAVNTELMNLNHQKA